MKKLVSHSIARRLSLTVLLTNGIILLIGGGVVIATNLGAGPLVMMAGTSTIFLACATWYAARRLVSRPILGLAETVRGLSAAHDHSVRVTKHSQDEVGQLVDALNGLLAEMQERDHRLEELEAQVAAQTREIGESTKGLEAATIQSTTENQSWSQFIAKITHELRTPMNGVFGMTELLFDTDLTPKQQKFTRAVLDSAEDLVSIVNNIQDFSKVDAGKFERIDNKPFSPSECVERVFDLLAARAHLEGLALSHECADDIPTLMLGDGKRLRQVLTNLIGNAIKFTERGTIVVRTSVVEHRSYACTIRFEVVDTGIGIPSYLHKDIFEGFLQADTSTTRQFGGTGLGLAISRRLVDLMGGEIGVVSRPDVGSNFWFTIQGELSLPDTTTDLDLGGVRALVVATTATSGDALRNQLATCGVDSVVVPSAEKALAALRVETADQPLFDVALIDTQALDSGGLVREIRADAASQSLPLVLICMVERGSAALKEAGVNGALTKPVREEELFACVARVTGRPAVSILPDDREAECPDSAPVAGARVLVAEDNRVNREVAQTMLETLGCRVDVVADGVQTVEAVQRERYDLVFLDCEMPNLDGYEATRQIRRVEHQSRRETEGEAGPLGHLPIVALTAYISTANRARGLEIGMDDYVSKPFSVQTLRGVLRKWVGGRVASAPTPVFPTSAHAGRTLEDDVPISQAALEQIRELDRLSGGGVFARVVRIFLEETPSTLEELRTAVRVGDAVRIARAAHALKSACLNVGAEPMALVSKELEALGRNGTTDGTASLATRLDELYLAVEVALQARLERDHREDDRLLSQPV